MALIECPECKREISDRAASCPHCGCPISQQAKAAGTPAQAGDQGQETILWSGRPVLFRGAPGETIFVVLCMAIALAAVLVFVDWQLWFLGFSVLGALAGVALLKSYASKLTVTGQRTVLKRGILVRSMTAIRHAEAESVEVEQGILQRLFKTGNLTVRATGAPGMEIKIEGIEHPDKVAALVRQRQGG